MNEINVLIVEDDENQQKLYDKAIREFNSNHPQEKIHPDFKKTLQEAMESLESAPYDAAIIDLKLRSDSVEAEGNKIIKKIKESQRYPVIVVSGFVEELDVEFKEETDVFRIIERTACRIPSLLTEIAEWYSSGITRFLRGGGELLTSVNLALQEIFWTYIAKNWNSWKEDVRDSENLKRIIKRYLSSILLERLQLTSAGFEKLYPAEVYFIPPVKQDYFTGDILKKNEKYYLILSPACDMVVRDENSRNAEIILTCRLIPWNEKEEFVSFASTQSNENKGKVKSIIENKKNRYHFLPPYGEFTGFVIDFQDVNQIPVSALKSYSREAEVTDFFLSNIIARFSTYYSRQGQPEIDSDMIIAKIKNQSGKRK